MSHFSVGHDAFLLDGQPHRIISGALHYFRIRPGHWRDRIRKARMLGLNTIETYVAWNFHAPTPEEFLTGGDRDLGLFLDLVHEEGLHAIVRPGPYICAEWDNGGLPWWLTADPEVGLRRDEPRYMAAVETYLRHVAGIVADRQIEAGGPVVLMQVENEYGAYGDDKEYLAHLVEIYRALGLTVPLFTVDQPRGDMLRDGSLPGVLATGSFGSQVPERLAVLRDHQSQGPLMCSEFWNGWFDHWGGHHHVTSAPDSAAALDELLARGASVNIYMVHGGTNFGLTSGANDKGTYLPTVTSYDYSAPLSEDGQPTEKYWAFREVIARYAPVPEEVPEPAAEAPSFEVPLERGLGLLDAVDDLLRWRESPVPATFEELSHPGALVLHRHDLGTHGSAVPGAGESRSPRTLTIEEVRDRAQVFLDGQPAGMLQRDHHDGVSSLPAGAGGVLEILVENQGRVNYADRLGEWKGISGVGVDGRPCRGWASAAVPTEPEALLAALGSRGTSLEDGGPLGGPVLASGVFQMEEPRDLFLHTGGWGKGLVWVNGFLLGRYWSRGPQHTLYVPSCELTAGANTLLVLELNGMSSTRARFVTSADLGHTEA